MRLTQKEKAAVGLIVSEGIEQSDYLLLEQLNFEGGYNFVEEYTHRELERIISWIIKKLGIWGL
jgi:hypothetical protein